MKRLIPTLLYGALAAAFGAQAATPQDTLVVVSSLEGIISLDPAESFETVSSANLVNLYQRLVAPDRAAPQKLAPDAAGSWQAGADGHSLTFTLKPQQRFASGNPLRPEDVIFSLVRAVKLNKAPSFILGEFGWTPDNVEQQLKKVGDNQVQLTWPANIGSELALRLLTANVASIVDEKLLNEHAQQGDYGNAWLRSHSAGGGPYRVNNYVPHEALLFGRNDYAPSPARLKTVLFKNVSDAGTRRLLLLKGDADVAYDLGADQFDSLRNAPGVRIEQADAPRIYYLGFNTGSKDNPALGNPALWQAARWLVDYQSIAEQLLKGQCAGVRGGHGAGADERRAGVGIDQLAGLCPPSAGRNPGAAPQRLPGGSAYAGHQRAAADGRPHFAFMPAERGGARGVESGRHHLVRRRSGVPRHGRRAADRRMGIDGGRRQ